MNLYMNTINDNMPLLLILPFLLCNNRADYIVLSLLLDVEILDVRMDVLS